MAQHTSTKHPLVLRRVQVARVLDVTPRMRRITVTGEQLSAFDNGEFELPEFITQSFDDHVKLIFAADGDIESALPLQRARSIDWPPSEHRQGRDYTPRRWNSQTRELDLDFVLHGDGPAARWASTAKPGDQLHFAGPKTSLVLPDDIDWMILAGDETALPAIGRFLQERPLDVPVHVVVEVRDPAARQDLAVRKSDTIRWIVTPEWAPSSLSDAIREIEWSPGSPYVWVAGESRSLVSLRNWLRRDQEMPASHVNVTGYWHERTETHSGQRAVPDAGELLDPLPWLATRAAVELGVLEGLGRTPIRPEALATAVGIGPSQLSPLLTYLESIDVVTSDAAGSRIGPVGEQILDNDHLAEELFGSGRETRLLDALIQLAPAMRGGVSAWQQAYTCTLAEAIENDAALYGEQVEDSGAFAFVASGVLDLPAWKEAERIVVTGPGALTLAAVARDNDTLGGVVLSGGPIALGVLAEQRGDLDVPVLAPAQIDRADLVVSTLEMHYRNDVELAAHLDAPIVHANRALLIDALQRTGPGGPQGAFEHAFLQLGMTGLGPRRQVDVERIAGDNGWQAVDRTALGWDFEVFEMRR